MKPINLSYPVIALCYNVGRSVVVVIKIYAFLGMVKQRAITRCFMNEGPSERVVYYGLDIPIYKIP